MHVGLFALIVNDDDNENDFRFKRKCHRVDYVRVMATVAI